MGLLRERKESPGNSKVKGKVKPPKKKRVPGKEDSSPGTLILLDR